MQFYPNDPLSRKNNERVIYVSDNFMFELGINLFVNCQEICYSELKTNEPLKKRVTVIKKKTFFFFHFSLERNTSQEFIFFKLKI